ncbi:MAG TPA: STAS domain-containing protein [Actinomycetota bacterium]|nr:STAS domain-containing protein [Actinomycetota bacterium]
MSRSAFGTSGFHGALLRVVETGPRTFRLVGELDVSSTGPLADLLATDLAGPGDLTLDLRGLTFMDSAGIHLFIKTATALTGRGNLRLLEPASGIARVIETTGLERLENLVVVGADAGRGPV